MVPLPSVEPFHGNVLPRGGRLLILGAPGGGVLGEEVVQFGSKGGRSVGAQLSLLTLILLHQASLIRLREILPALLPDLVDHPHKDLFRSTVSGLAMPCRASNIASSNIGSSIDRERNAVGDFPSPTYSYG